MSITQEINERIARKQAQNRQGGDGKIRRYIMRRAAKQELITLPSGFGVTIKF